MRLIKHDPLTDPDFPSLQALSPSQKTNEKMPIHCQPRRSSFTLTELLVVIAIIAILASFLLPSLRNALAIADTSVCANNQRQTGMGLLMYCDDNNGFLPNLWQNNDLIFTDAISIYINSPGVIKRTWATSGTYAYNSLYTPYQYIYTSKSVFICPEAAKNLVYPFTGSSAGYFISNYSPTCTDGSSTSGAYPYAWWRSSSQTYANPAGRKLNQILGKIIVGEQRYYHAASIGGNTVCRTTQAIKDWCGADSIYLAENQYAAGNVHNRGTTGNWLFKDGHVSCYIFNSKIINSSSKYFMGL